jgi:predicted cobalt transporter CbtA
MESSKDLQKQNNNKANIGLMLGIIGLVSSIIPIVGLPVNIAGIILGIKGIKSYRKSKAIATIILSSIGIILTIFSAVIGIHMATSGKLK